MNDIVNDKVTVCCYEQHCEGQKGSQCCERQFLLILVKLYVSTRLKFFLSRGELLVAIYRTGF